MASTDFGYCVFILEIKKTQMYLPGFPQNHLSWYLTFVNLAADWRIFVCNFVLYALTLRIVSV